VSSAIQPPPVAPAKIYELSCAYWNTQVLLSAAQLGIFAMLGNGPATAGKIQEELGLHPLAVRDFLDSLTALGLLQREGNTYRNSPEAGTYLVPGQPHFMGPYLEFVDKVVRPSWDGLSDLLRQGKPQYHQPAPDGPGTEDQEVPPSEFFERQWGNEETQRLFLAAADGLSVEIAWELTRRIDWSKWENLVDLGCARGNLTGILLSASPHLRATGFDMPQLAPLFEQHMASLGLTGRTRFEPGDWFKDKLPEGDVLLCSHALHNWTTEERRTVIEKAYHATRPGGALLICELMIDDDRSRLNPLLLSLLMMLGMSGSGYTTGECRALMEGAGFTQVETVTLHDYDKHTVMIGHKKG
jgi:SAM-dependent methyltransferase